MTVLIGVRPDDRSRRQVADGFRNLIEGGAVLRPVGSARSDPRELLGRTYLPRHAVSIFGVTFYLTDFRYEEGLNFFVGYVAPRPRQDGRPPVVHPRIFYKDSSLIWRVASHLISTDEDDWIGKGDLRRVLEGDEEHWVSDEDTTNLPYELQSALDEISRRRRSIRDERALRLILRSAPTGRFRPYADFTAPRVQAAARGRLNRGRPVARMTRVGDPASLKFAAGFAPDFADGVIEVGTSASRLYGGKVRKYRVLSDNGRVQYQFVATPTHVWVNPPQALTEAITSYGIRALHVAADEEVFLPGYEYHYLDDSEDPPELISQIPAGFAGAQSTADPSRADASAWIEALPVIREFRRRVLSVK